MKCPVCDEDLAETAVCEIRRVVCWGNRDEDVLGIYCDNCGFLVCSCYDFIDELALATGVDDFKFLKRQFTLCKIVGIGLDWYKI